MWPQELELCRLYGRHEWSASGQPALCILIPLSNSVFDSSSDRQRCGLGVSINHANASCLVLTTWLLLTEPPKRMCSIFFKEEEG